MSKTATITYPEELARILELSDEQLVKELSFMAAAKLYELGRVTAGQASALAGTDRLTFLRRLSATGVPAINLRGSEVEAEIRAARDLAG